MKHLGNPFIDGLTEILGINLKSLHESAPTSIEETSARRNIQESVLVVIVDP